MFFEGCPRCFGCTVLLKGSCHEELRKVKHVVQCAVFAAYHLSLETSFLEDEYGVSDLLNDGLTATCISEEYRLGVVSAESRNFDWEASQLTINHMQSCESFNQKKHEQLNDIDASSEYNLAGDSHQSILDLFQVAVSLMEVSNVLDSCTLCSMVLMTSHLEGIFKKICLIRHPAVNHAKSRLMATYLSYDRDNDSVSDMVFQLPDFLQKDIPYTQDREPETSLVDSGIPKVYMDGEPTVQKTPLDRAPSAASELSDKIDSLWNGTADGPFKLPSRRLPSPARLQSIDSAQMSCHSCSNLIHINNTTPLP
ncbi:hypothetical protein ACET3Z_024503 [Daucus carota]